MTKKELLTALLDGKTISAGGMYYVALIEAGEIVAVSKAGGCRTEMTMDEFIHEELPTFSERELAEARTL